MGKYQQTARCFTLITGYLTGLFLMQSCSIKEDFSDCITEETVLYVKVVDTATGNDITESGMLENAFLYIFDENEHFIRSYYLSASQIAQKEPVLLNEGQQIFISAWGDLTNETSISEVTKNSTMKDVAASLLQDAKNPEYALSPNNFFFGSKKINRQQKDAHRQEVILMQKNAKLHITVKGLAYKNQDTYFFKIQNSYSGYNFNGVPFNKTTVLKKNGIFNEYAEYISPEPYLLIHSANPEQQTEENSIRIQVYKETGENETELVNINKDTVGNYLTLFSGKTTNILIDMTPNEQIIIKVKVTPWDEIVQWSEH